MSLSRPPPAQVKKKRPVNQLCPWRPAHCSEQMQRGKISKHAAALRLARNRVADVQSKFQTMKAQPDSHLVAQDRHEMVPFQQQAGRPPDAAG